MHTFKLFLTHSKQQFLNCWDIVKNQFKRAKLQKIVA